MTDSPLISRDVTGLDASGYIPLNGSELDSADGFNSVLSDLNIDTVSSQFELLERDLTYRYKKSTDPDTTSSYQSTEKKPVTDGGVLNSDLVDQVLAGSSIPVGTIPELVAVLQKTIVHFSKKESSFTRTYFFELPNQGFHVDVFVEKGASYRVSLLVDRDLYALLLAYQDELIAYLKKKGMTISSLHINLQLDSDSTSENNSDDSSQESHFSDDNDEADWLI